MLDQNITRIMTAVAAVMVIGGMVIFLFGQTTIDDEGAVVEDQSGYAEEFNENVIENSQKRRHKY